MLLSGFLRILCISTESRYSALTRFHRTPIERLCRPARHTGTRAPRLRHHLPTVRLESDANTGSIGIRRLSLKPAHSQEVVNHGRRIEQPCGTDVRPTPISSLKPLVWGPGRTGDQAFRQDKKPRGSSARLAGCQNSGCGGNREVICESSSRTVRRLWRPTSLKSTSLQICLRNCNWVHITAVITT